MLIKPIEYQANKIQTLRRSNRLTVPSMLTRRKLSKLAFRPELKDEMTCCSLAYSLTRENPMALFRLESYLTHKQISN